MNVCRSLEYYINIESEHVVELGTRQYPYKDLSSVFVEIVELHSNTDRSIIINVKEDTINYLMVKQNYVININSITIKSYSDRSTSPNKATIISYDSESKNIAYVITSMFNILNRDQFTVDDKLSMIDGLTDYERIIVEEEYSVITVISSNIYINNINIFTEYQDKSRNYRFIRLVKPQEKVFSLMNSNVRVDGYTLYTDQQTIIELKSIMIYNTHAQNNFKVDMSCSNADQISNASLTIENVTFELSNDEMLTTQLFGVINYIGNGNVTIDTINSRAISDFNNYQIYIMIDARCRSQDNNSMPLVLSQRNLLFSSNMTDTSKCMNFHIKNNFI